MKKLFKLGAFCLVASSVVFTSGCSCSINKEKVDERVTALKDTSLLKKGDEFVDFTATYSIDTKGENDTIINTRYIVASDVEHDKYKLIRATKVGDAEPVNEEYVIFKKDGKVYYKINGAETATNKGTTFFVYMDSYEVLGIDFYKFLW